jgi:hypothetical protein
LKYLLLLIPSLALSQGYYYAKASSVAPPRSSTFFGAAFGHADSSSTAGPGPQSVTPPASMVAGDLVILVVSLRNNVSVYINGLGGQTWDSTANVFGTIPSSHLYWCEFNGTWSANPSGGPASDGSALTVGMWVFRPSDGASHVWAVDATLSGGSETVAADSTFTTNSINPTIDSTITFALFHSQDDNAWNTGGTSNPTNPSWGDGTPSSLGHKNIAGSDQSIDAMYLLQTALITNVSAARKQTARGGDNGLTLIVTFK